MTNRRKHTLVISLTFLLGLGILVVFSSAASRLGGRRIRANPKQEGKDAASRRQQERWDRYPAVDYNEPEPADSAAKAKRRNKNKHYDGKRLVSPALLGSTVITMEDSEVFFHMVPLPVTSSGVILIAHTLSSEAHLSNDKSAVYTEFTVQVDSVLKGIVPTLSQTNLISVTRTGGLVRYPSGRTQIYGISHQNMPRLSTKYLFFLKLPDEAQVYELLTGYEMGEQQVHPLDDGSFQEYDRMDTNAFLNVVRAAIAKD